MLTVTQADGTSFELRVQEVGALTFFGSGVTTGTPGVAFVFTTTQTDHELVKGSDIESRTTEVFPLPML